MHCLEVIFLFVIGLALISGLLFSFSVYISSFVLSVKLVILVQPLMADLGG
jgi:hypothetical protein